ncbi:tetratricopeptide repeat protein [Frischella sp. Ac48]|uniref:tetratricopeptide repeat protein n=1 Tax=Frischella sp. Ac48 TaxID=2804531 RepID=UPI001C7D87A9|nr:tetratricopeptide repeat protein [Frischella sp. Ac48]MBX4132126.1 tetratricopeptide repeat protein [Frischella sp. Ac48]
MTEQEADELLEEVNYERLFGDTAKAIAILHQLNLEFPQEKMYLGLLASCYYSNGELDLALEYAEKALALDSNYKEIYELKGLIAYAKGDQEEAEMAYQQALKIDPQFALARVRLMQLYFEKKEYNKVTDECWFILNKIVPDRLSYDKEKKSKLNNDYLNIVYYNLWKALIAQRKYDEAANVIIEYKDFASSYITDPYFFDKEDELLFKLFYLLDDKEKTDYYQNRWLNFYQVVPSLIDGMKKDVEQGYITNMNPDNYNIDEYGDLY